MTRHIRRSCSSDLVQLGISPKYYYSQIEPAELREGARSNFSDGTVRLVAKVSLRSRVADANLLWQSEVTGAPGLSEVGRAILTLKMQIAVQQKMLRAPLRLVLETHSPERSWPCKPAASLKRAVVVRNYRRAGPAVSGLSAAPAEPPPFGLVSPLSSVTGTLPDEHRRN